MNTLNKDFSLREFNPNDLEELKQSIYKTINISYARVYSLEARQYFKIRHSNVQILEDAILGFTLVLELNGKIIGTGTIVDKTIMRVFIDPFFQHKGYGKLIMEKLENIAFSNGVLTVDLSASLVAKRFYDSLGYKTIRKSKIVCENNQILNDEKYELEKSFL